MKNLIIILILSIGILTVNAQESKQSRKESREERNAIKTEKIKKALESNTFTFEPSHMIPLGGGTRYLNHSYEVEVKNDSVYSYLPFWGVAYHVQYGGRDSGFDFSLPLKDYEFSKDKKGYHIHFETKKGHDVIVFNFHISEQGYTTLNVNSTNRQAISYYGSILTD